MKKLIIGLSNKSKEYTNTRHNAGRIIVDGLEKDLPSEFIVGKTDCYMNESGIDVAKILKYYKLTPKNLVIVHDDLDLPFGAVRFALGGSSAGHKGVQSVIDHLKTEDFWRVRIGIGRDENIPPEAFVLQKFSVEQLENLAKGLDKIGDSLLELKSKDIYI